MTLCVQNAVKNSLTRLFDHAKEQSYVKHSESKGTPSHSCGVSLAIWDHTVLPSTRHK